MVEIYSEMAKGKRLKDLVKKDRRETANIYKRLKAGATNIFNTVLQGKDITIGVSRQIGKWPYSEFSVHMKDEILVVLNGDVEVEYEDGKRVRLKKGDVEVMLRQKGHKVHAIGKRADTMLIFADTI